MKEIKKVLINILVCSIITAVIYCSQFVSPWISTPILTGLGLYFIDKIAYWMVYGTWR